MHPVSIRLPQLLSLSCKSKICDVSISRFRQKFSKPSLSSRYSHYSKARFAKRPFGPALQAHYGDVCRVIVHFHVLNVIRYFMHCSHFHSEHCTIIINLKSCDCFVIGLSHQLSWSYNENVCAQLELTLKISLIDYRTLYIL
jgi:hypothetical protein